MKCSVAIELMKKDLMATGCTIKEMEVFLRYAELLYYVGVNEGLNMQEKKGDRPILQLKNGFVINRFESIKSAAKTLNTSGNKIQQVLVGFRKTWNGYSYVYEDDSPNF